MGHIVGCRPPPPPQPGNFSIFFIIYSFEFFKSALIHQYLTLQVTGYPAHLSGYLAQVSEYPAQASGYLAQVAGCPAQVAGNMVQVAGYLGQEAGYPVQVSGYPVKPYSLGATSLNTSAQQKPCYLYKMVTQK